MVTIPKALLVPLVIICPTNLHRYRPNSSSVGPSAPLVVNARLLGTILETPLEPVKLDDDDVPQLVVSRPEGDNDDYDESQRGDELRLFEGDIVATWASIKTYYGEDEASKLVEMGLIKKDDDDDGDDEFEGDAVSTDRFRWVERDFFDDLVIVPYVFSSDLNGSQRRAITNAANKLARASGYFKFVERSTEVDYIKYKGGFGCSSYVGRKGGEQVMTLGSCSTSNDYGSIIHEHIHTLGFWHEHSRPDRDDYVRIEWENIAPNRMHEFVMKTASRTLGVPYDYKSIMHYPKGAFAKESGLQTIVTLPNGKYDDRIGARGRPSRLDLEGLRLLYQCESGSRTRSQLEDEPCTPDCKCPEYEMGCNALGFDDDNLCMGSLVCVDNMCVKTPLTYLEYRNKAHPEKCMDLKVDASTATTVGFSLANGSPVQLSPCNGAPGQKWRIDKRGYIRSGLDDDKCVEPKIRRASGENGMALQIWDCVANDDHQLWDYQVDGTFRPRGNSKKCIDVRSRNSGDVDDGVPYQLQIWDCDGSEDKFWSNYFEIKSHEDDSSKCMNLPWGEMAENNGVLVSVGSCSGELRERWRLNEDGYIQNAVNDGKCLVPLGRAEDEDPVVMWDCQPNYAYMKWYYNGDSSFSLQNKPYMCLDFDDDDYVIVRECEELNGTVWSYEFPSARFRNYVPVLLPEQDTAVRGGTFQNQNYGTSPTLVVGNGVSESNVWKSILEFDLGHYAPSTIADADLFLHVAIVDVDSSSSPITITPMIIQIDSVWEENGLTYADIETAKIEKEGSPFDVTLRNEGALFFVDIRDLIDGLVLKQSSKLVIMLQNQAVAGPDTLCAFSSRESDNPPKLSIKLKPKLFPTKDAYIRGGFYRDEKYGTVPFLGVRKDSNLSNMERSILEFDLGGYMNAAGSTIKGATLRLFIANGQADVPITIMTVRLPSSYQWEENQMTWRELQQIPIDKMGSSVTITPDDKQHWFDIDVTDFIQELGGSKLIILLQHYGVSGPSTYVQFHSRENDSPPELVLTL
eukprot:CAMPEP_0172502824 /NCGR_PEP_ID=MMETSP1066-20121228/163069_1 /TAXON_ID=671091 /ORGANISM="Coscinodiscus wailesii, Strain CCMP2513" /LENGTH=1023 /DNA_ID=CAMNT_0013278223 /DNA_START=40 /DNA_END=3111 /DNA_ORIENTATION=-